MSRNGGAVMAHHAEQQRQVHKVKKCKRYGTVSPEMEASKHRVAR